MCILKKGYSLFEDAYFVEFMYPVVYSYVIVNSLTSEIHKTTDIPVNSRNYCFTDGFHEFHKLDLRIFV